MASPDRYCFGDFVLDRPGAQLLRRDGALVALTPRLFDALLLFAQHPGELLAKDFLIERLWPGLVVEENNLNQVVLGLRRALGDDGSRFIRTVPRRGFRFVAAVSSEIDGVPVASPPPVPKHSRRFYLGASGAVAACAAAAGWWALRDPRPTRGAGVTLAVLPFQALSTGADDELLGVGMADSIVQRVSLQAGVVVHSTGSVLHRIGPSRDAMHAGRELEVEWILDGTVQRHGQRVRAAARLVRVSDGAAVWSGGFEEKLADIFDVQDQIADRVAQELAPLLALRADATPAAEAEMAGTRSFEAYELYLAAVRKAESGTSAGYDRAAELLEQALAVDPRFARAWTVLAWTYRYRAWSVEGPPQEVFRASNQALEHALAQAPSLAQVRHAVGIARFLFEFDREGAEREFRRAVAANPSFEGGHFALGMLLVSGDRIEEGMIHIRRARECGSMSAHLNSWEAGFLLAQGRIEQARLRVRRALDLGPGYWTAHVAQAALHVSDGREQDAIASLRRATQLAGEQMRATSNLGMLLARTGHREEAQAIVERLVARARQRYVPGTVLAAMQAALGDKEAALSSLERALADRDDRLVYLKDDPRWITLRGHPRFTALMRALKLDRYGRGLCLL